MSQLEDTTSPSPGSTLQPAAEAYVRLNLHVIPLQPGSKAPLIKCWPSLASSDPEQIARWWNKWPDANIGLLTGAKLRPGGYLAVVDIDDDGADFFAKRARRDWPFRVAQSRRGVHLHFITPEPMTNMNPVRAVTLKGLGGYIVAPPSVVGGKTYRWLTPCEDLLTMPHASLKTPRLFAYGIAARSWLRDNGGLPVLEGERNNRLTQVAGFLRGRGACEEELLLVLSLANRGVCKPPLPDLETASIAKSIAQRPADRRAPQMPLLAPTGEALQEDIEALKYGDEYRRSFEGQHHQFPRRYGRMTLPVEVTPQPAPVIDGLLVPLSEFLKEAGADVPWLWEPLIGEGLITLLAAALKAGKSTLIAHLLLAMAKGERFLGCPTERPPRVILFTEERLSLSRRMSDLGVEEAAKEKGWLLVNRKSPSWRQIVAALGESPEGTLVVLDTGSRFWPVDDENDAAQVNKALQPLIALAQERQLAIVFVHHMGKAAGRKPQDTQVLNYVRGSSALAGTVDVIVGLLRRKGNRRWLVADGRFEPVELVAELVDGKYQASDGPGSTLAAESGDGGKPQVQADLSGFLPHEELISVTSAALRPEDESHARLMAALETLIGADETIEVTASEIAALCGESPAAVGKMLGGLGATPAPRKAGRRGWRITREWMDELRP